ncbi:MAG: hypothetical protein K2K67_09290 [Treponemataceae bacterium]|nr:hypothetical protein [Treponemataceae bacterium]
MKKYIGLVCGAVLFAVLAAGCSGAYGFDGNGSGGRNPFADTTWESSYGMYLSFSDDTVVYYTGGQRLTYDYSPKHNSDGSYEAAMKFNGQSMGSFRISNADADAGSYGGYTYTRN